MNCLVILEMLPSDGIYDPRYHLYYNLSWQPLQPRVLCAVGCLSFSQEQTCAMVCVTYTKHYLYSHFYTRILVVPRLMRPQYQSAKLGATGTMPRQASAITLNWEHRIKDGNHQHTKM